MATGSQDDEGVRMSELSINTRTLKYRDRRSRRKAKVTRCVNEMKDLMLDDRNVSRTTAKFVQGEQAVHDFLSVHDEYHKLLHEEDQPASTMYRDMVVKDFGKCKINFEHWVKQIKRDVQRRMEVSLDDIQSASQMNIRHRAGSKASSSSSKASSIASARLREAAEAAALQAEAEALREQQELEREELLAVQHQRDKELHFKQRRQDVEMCSKLAKVKARERIYAEAEIAFKKDVLHSTPYDVKSLSLTTKPKLDDNPLNSSALSKRRQHRDEASLFSSVDSHTSLEDMFIQVINDNKRQQQSLIETLQLPKTELMTFNGTPENYWPFIRSFENSVDKDTIDDGAKLMRLMQYCSGPAKKLIQCCMVKKPEEGNALARKLLKERIGSKYDITEAWIAKITNHSDIVGGKALQDFADDLRNCQETLKTMDSLTELNNRGSLLKIIEKLPMDLRKSWLNVVYDIKTDEDRNPSISDIVKFVSRAAKKATDPVFGQLVSNRDTKSKTKKQDKTKKSNQKSAFSTQHSEKNAEQPTQRSSQSTQCQYCGQEHSLFGCSSFKALKPPERLNFVQSRRLCVNCLKSGHSARDCQRQTVCTVPNCGLKHTKFLHLLRPGDAGFTNRGTTASSSASTTTVTLSLSTLDSEPTPIMTQTATHGNASTNNHMTYDLTEAGVGKVVLPVVPVRVRGQGENHFAQHMLF